MMWEALNGPRVLYCRSMTNPAEAAFKKIADDYGWEQPVLNFMTAQSGLGATKVEDFLQMCSAESEVKDIVNQIPDVGNRHH